MNWYEVDYTDEKSLTRDLDVIERHDYHTPDCDLHTMHQASIDDYAYHAAGTAPQVIPHETSVPTLRMDYSNTDLASGELERARRENRRPSMRRALRAARLELRGGLER